jgi:hypothetical protein
MDSIKLEAIDDANYSLQIIYNHTVFEAIINEEKLGSALIGIDMLEKIIINGINKNLNIVQNLTVETIFDHDIISDNLEIELNLDLNRSPLKNVKESLKIKLIKKSVGIEDKFDILLNNFEHKINQKIVRPMSKNTIVTFKHEVTKHSNGSILNEEITIFEGAQIFFRTTSKYQGDPPLISDDFADLFFSAAINKCVVTKTNAQEITNKVIFEYTKNNLNLLINKYLEYFCNSHYLNFIDFTEFYNADNACSTGTGMGNEPTFNKFYLGLLINAQLDKKPKQRKIHYSDGISAFDFKNTKMYNILSKCPSTYDICFVNGTVYRKNRHCICYLIEEL